MKPKLHSLGSSRGAALVLVLAMLVLVTLVAVGFFARSLKLRTATSREVASMTTRTLADTAVNLVQAQIDATASSGNGTVWATQPGAIRLHNADGSLKSISRLYSASELSATTTAQLSDDTPPADWASNKALWSDLNAPAVSNDGTGQRVLQFPILDPRDPANLANVNPVEGFRIDSAPGATTDQPAPMPVRWLYVLQDGQIISPQPSGTGAVTVGNATSTNPIVGRIAFWTDDETSKLNINTSAGAGTAAGSQAVFWDTPRFDGPDERRMSINQPAQGEYQRYPGHPATTGLAKVFPTLSSQDLLKIAPAFRFGGSEDGTKIPTSAVPPKAERFYASVGEMLYASDRSTNPVNIQTLESARFLLTAHSRAPELNLFGTPRVSVWPVSSDPAKRSPIDGLLSFAARINNKDYGFVRSAPLSTTADISDARNNALLNYLDALTQRVVPGAGGSFDNNNKYPSDRRDILVKIFDYIRSTNLNDPTNPGGGFAPEGSVAPARHAAWGVQGFGRFPVLHEVSIWFVALGRGAQTSPASPAIPIHAQQVGTRADSADPAYWVNATTPANDRVAVQALFLISYFDPAQGWIKIHSANTPPALLKILGLDGLAVTVDGSSYPLQFPASTTTRFPNTTDFRDSRPWGGVHSFRNLLVRQSGAPRPLGPNSSDAGENYPLYSAILSLPASAATMTLGAAAPVTAELFAGTSSSPGARVSTYTFDLSQLSGSPMPVPTLANNASNSLGLPTSLSAATRRAARDRIQFAIEGEPDHQLRTTVAGSNDVLWSLIPTASSSVRGDFRLLAKETIDATIFKPHPSVAANTRMAFTSFSDIGTLMQAAVPGGSLVANATYNPGQATSPVKMASVPVAVPGLNGVTAGTGTAPGDWDNGFSVVMDGPYINKADEGNILGIYSTPPSSPYFDASIWNVEGVNGAMFSPNRMIPSAGMLGSLPTGVVSGQPWQTLLFRPAQAAHKGMSAPRDHLLLDLFWMPVAEPYAISEPFSTAGKVNLNYQIQPFTYITRNTALRSVLASERVARVRRSDANVYKTRPATGSGLTSDARRAINLDETGGTLRQFRERFQNGGIFLSPTEICDVFLVPEGETWTSDSAALSEWYGDNFALVGDNTRERPYANLLGRLTTKSNTFTVHYTVQALKKVPGSQPGTWTEGKDKVLGTLRGSTMIERYLDPEDPALPDYPTDLSKIDSDPLDGHYRWRIIQNRTFAP